MSVKRISGRRIIALCGAVLIWVSIFAIPGVLVEQASAGCEAPSIGFGRWKWCGFYHNGYDSTGGPVRVGGVQAHVNTVEEFITQVNTDASSGNMNWMVSSAFIVHTMIGRGLGMPKILYGSEMTEFAERMRLYSNISENGAISYGTSGSIEWHLWAHTGCGSVNTYAQDAFQDVAPYLDNTGNSNCANPAILSDFIIFRDTNGAQRYLIRRICMNPMGNLLALPDTPPPNFNVNPIINPLVNGAASAGVAELGDTISFTYSITNSGPGATTGTPGCSLHANNRPGYFATPAVPTYTGSFVPFPYSCPPPLAAGGSYTFGTETITVTTPNMTICRSLFIWPGSQASDMRGTEVCIPVANKPYLKVYGGDVMAGSGLETAPNDCSSTLNNNAEIISWNRRTAANYAGAGVEYAAIALNAITDFASAQHNMGSTTPPTALSFANTSTNAANGNFGGTYGGGACISDYYATRSTAGTLTPLFLTANVSSLSDGAYASNGPLLTLTGGSIVNPGDNITVYVDGDVHILSNITYAGSWTYNNIPSFQVIATGNIYISGNVTQLDGNYIAQRDGANTGTIYTCTTGALPLPLSATLYSNCNNKLTVNGSFVANSIEFLRTRGSQGQAGASEASTSNNIAEVFNYGPAFWIPQPLPAVGGSEGYDSITSLPPVL